MEIKFNGLKLKFKDEMLLSDFEKILLPPLDLSKFKKGDKFTMEDAEKMIPWMGKYLRIMANDTATIEFMKNISMPSLVGIIQVPEFIQMMMHSIGADAL
jgi:hypothetical protein